MFEVVTSPGVATTLENVRVVPTALFSGVMGTRNVEFAPLAIGPAFVQVTDTPDVTQPNPLLVKVAGAVTLAGSVSVVVMGPVVAPEPILLTVMGKLLV